MEQICKQTDTSLFMVASHNKKRPNNLVIGRTYEHKVLDMAELAIKQVKTIDEVNASLSIPANVQPFMFFQGDLWESHPEFKQLKSMLNDFFLANNRPSKPQID